MNPNVHTENTAEFLIERMTLAQVQAELAPTSPAQRAASSWGGVSICLPAR
jgi:hypothetical protein